MSEDTILGSFEEQVLLAVVHCGAEAYGMTVRRELEARARRSVSIGAVYTTLDRLEGKGFVVTRLADGDEARQGRARKYFRLLPEGARALSRSREVSRQMWEGVDLAAFHGEGAEG